jgi:pimeloyl-ACP methyl ester carboxylesterase
MMLAAHNPNLISRLMVVDMPPVLAPMIGGPEATVETVRAYAEQSRQQIAAAKDEPARRRVAEMVVGKTRAPGDRAASIAYWLASDPRVTSQGMFELFTTDLRPDLRKVRLPLTILWAAPERSPLNEAQAAELYALSFSGAPQAVVRNIPDSHHLIMLDQPAIFQAELRAFLSGE